MSNNQSKHYFNYLVTIGDKVCSYAATSSEYKDSKLILLDDGEVIAIFSEFDNCIRKGLITPATKEHFNTTAEKGVYGSIEAINYACGQLTAAVQHPEMFLTKSDIDLIHKVVGSGCFNFYHGVTIKRIEDI